MNGQKDFHIRTLPYPKSSCVKPRFIVQTVLDTFMQYLRLLLAVAITLCTGVFSIRADDTPQQAAARAALMQQMNSSDNGAPAPGSVPQPPPQMPATPPEQQVTPPPPAPAPEQPATLPPTAQVSTNLIVSPVEQESVPLPTNTVPPVQQSQPMMAPAAPISADQQQQLQQLLSKYMANQITPAQYQEERSAILKGQ
jgi:hypothetical protein